MSYTYIDYSNMEDDDMDLPPLPDFMVEEYRRLGEERKRAIKIYFQWWENRTDEQNEIMKKIKANNNNDKQISALLLEKMVSIFNNAKVVDWIIYSSDFCSCSH